MPKCIQCLNPVTTGSNGCPYCGEKRNGELDMVKREGLCSKCGEYSGECKQHGGDNVEDSNEQQASVQVEIPRYKCHKEVRAAKITDIESHESDGTGSHTMVFGEIGGRKFLTDDWKDRFKPEVGGYFVMYEGGYTSFSPAKAFEDGYTRV